jgi:hypothetical protein
MQPYRIPGSTARLSLTIFTLLVAAPLSLHAKDEPQGSWVTTKQVKVRCSDGYVVGVINENTEVRVVETGEDGRLMVQGLSLKDDLCTEHYIAAQYLRPKELVFWKLDERWRKGIDVDGTHYSAGAAFQVLTRNRATRALTIIGPRGISESLTITADLANERFFSLPWDIRNNFAYCATPESARGLVAHFLTIFGNATTMLWEVLALGLLLGIHILNGFSRRGFQSLWLLGTLPSAVLCYSSTWSYVQYETSWNKCEAARTFLTSRTAPNGLVLPIKEASRIEPEPLRDIDGKVIDLSAEKWLIDHAMLFFFVFLPCNAVLFIRGAIMICLSANAELSEARAEEALTSEKGEYLVSEDVQTSALTVVPGESGRLAQELHPQSRQIPELEVPTYSFGFMREHAIKKTNQETELIQAMTENVAAETILKRTKSEQDNLPIVVATDEQEKTIKMLDAQRRLLEAQIAILKLEAIAEIELKNLELQLAEIQAKLDQIRNPPPPEDEAVKRQKAVDRKFDERYGTEEAIRATEERYKAETLRRAGGKITPEVRRWLNNYRDFAQRQIDEL